MSVPQEAVEAAIDKACAVMRSDVTFEDIAQIVEAAAPFIRADSQRHSGIRIDRRKLEGWDDAPPLTGQDWREFAESLPASEHATAILAIADALDEGAR